MKTPVGIFAEGVAALNEKAWDDSMKRRPVKKIQFGQVEKILDVARGVIGEKPNFNVPQFGGNNRFGIFFLELERRRVSHSEGTLASLPKVHQVTIR